jgi:hypothetical protein
MWMATRVFGVDLQSWPCRLIRGEGVNKKAAHSGAALYILKEGCSSSLNN